MDCLARDEVVVVRLADCVPLRLRPAEVDVLHARVWSEREHLYPFHAARNDERCYRAPLEGNRADCARPVRNENDGIRQL